MIAALALGAACILLPYAAITVADMRQQRRRRARERFEREFIAPCERRAKRTRKVR